MQAAAQNGSPVSLRVGSIEKVVTVIGDRYWEEGLAGRIRMSTPERFERIPLIYERAFGGFDQNDAERRACEVRNPVAGAFGFGGMARARSVLPNLEDPQNRIRSLSIVLLPPVSLLSPHWQPRVSSQGRMIHRGRPSAVPCCLEISTPLFQCRFAWIDRTGYLAGDEPVSVVNVSPNGSPTSHCRHRRAQVEVTLRDGGVQTLPTHLDTSYRR